MITLIAQKVDIYEGDGKHPHARTGELGFFHLKHAGAQGVLLGHSEVGESPKIVNKKLKAAHAAGLTRHIVLLGESWEDLGKPWSELSEEQKSQAKAVVKEKLIAMFAEINEQIVADIVLAYEPGWGVRGSGKSDVPPPSPEQIQAMAMMMRAALQERYSETVAQSMRILYGGSMSPERATEIMPLPDIDGFILGSAGTTVANVNAIGQSTIEGRKQRRPVLALNWKAYELGESYEQFIEAVKLFEEMCDIYIAPPATELRTLASSIKQ